MARPLALASIAAGAVIGATADTLNASIYLSGDAWSVQFGVVDKAGAVAYGWFVDYEGTTSGFGRLSIATNPAFNATAQSYGAGFAEGALTWPRIYDQYLNMHAWLQSNFAGGIIPPVYAEFFGNQSQWSRAQAAANSSAYWQAAAAVLSQFDGIVAGYGAVAPANMSLGVWEFDQLNAMGDFLDLIPALQPLSQAAKPWRWEEQTPAEIMAHVHRTTHCSALFKVTGNYSDIFFGHSSWFTYTCEGGEGAHVTAMPLAYPLSAPSFPPHSQRHLSHLEELQDASGTGRRHHHRQRDVILQLPRLPLLPG